MITNEGSVSGSQGIHRRRGTNTTRVALREEFDKAYKMITPAWEIGRPQRALLNLMPTGKIKGRVLDVGCGTGEHALMAAAVGLDAVGIDTSPTAIDIATRKARERGLKAKFLVSDVLQMSTLKENFDTILDCGMFHNLENDERVIFADGIRDVLLPGGRYFMLCFSDVRRRVGAARTVSQEEVRNTFIDGFRIDAIVRALIEENGSDGVPAWLVKISRVDIA